MDLISRIPPYPSSPGFFTFPVGASSCTPCPIGSFSNQTGTITCQTCPPGSVNPNAGALFCSLCAQGTYCDSHGKAVCTPCPPGTYSGVVGADSNMTCSLCPANYYSLAEGSTTCQPCGLGMYTINQGSTTPDDCLLCPIGTYSSSRGTPCLPCPLGQVSPAGAISCQFCPPGMIVDTTTNITCIQCLPGFFASEGAISCTPCPRGTFTATNGNWECSPCPAGSFSNIIAATNASVCFPCPFGTFSSQPASTYCSPCLPGTYSNVSGVDSAGNCLSCPPGTYSNYGFLSCEACLPGLYTSSYRSAFCQPCPIGSVPNVFQSDCSLCMPGYFASLGESSCEICPPGTFSNESGSSVCTTCPAGSFSASAGSTVMSCSQCPVGSFTPFIGSVSCFLCPAGTFGFKEGGSSQLDACISCPAGSYSDSGAQRCTLCPIGTAASSSGGGSLSSCLPCAPGSFANETGSDRCSLCPAGTFNSLQGSSSQFSCLPCLPGSFSPQPGSSACVSCSPNSFLNDYGGISCTPCPSGTSTPFSGSNSINNCVFCPPGQFLSSVNSCVRCPAGSFRSNPSAVNMTEACSTCPTGTYSFQIIGDECSPCSAGTYNPILGSDNCLPCAEGTYSASGASACQLCSPGYYSNRSGSTQCSLCPYNSYSASFNGSVNCTLCLDTEYCMTGSWQPIDRNQLQIAASRDFSGHARDFQVIPEPPWGFESVIVIETFGMNSLIVILCALSLTLGLVLFYIRVRESPEGDSWHSVWSWIKPFIVYKEKKTFSPATSIFKIGLTILFSLFALGLLFLSIYLCFAYLSEYQSLCPPYTPLEEISSKSSGRLNVIRTSNLLPLHQSYAYTESFSNPSILFGSLSAQIEITLYGFRGNCALVSPSLQLFGDNLVCATDGSKDLSNCSSTSSIIGNDPNTCVLNLTVSYVFPAAGLLSTLLLQFDNSTSERDFIFEVIVIQLATPANDGNIRNVISSSVNTLPAEISPLGARYITNWLISYVYTAFQEPSFASSPEDLALAAYISSLSAGSTGIQFDKESHAQEIEFVFQHDEYFTYNLQLKALQLPEFWILFIVSCLTVFEFLHLVHQLITVPVFIWANCFDKKEKEKRNLDDHDDESQEYFHLNTFPNAENLSHMDADFNNTLTGSDIEEESSHSDGDALLTDQN